MFDWNGNGKIDTDDHAFTAFLIDEMNKKNKESGFLDEEADKYDAPDYNEGEDDY